MNLFRKSRDFDEKTKLKLRDRVAHMCSNPMCRRLTVKAASEGDGVVRSGTAAHIHSAGRNGPRAKPEMPDNECASIVNGIWLCDACSRMIDADEAAYRAETLRKWKSDAEAYVFELVTQDTRLRQLRVILKDMLSAMRVLTAVPGPGPKFDQTFVSTAQISWARNLIELDLVLFENGFVDEAATVKRIGSELHLQIHALIARNAPNEHTDISAWKNGVVKTLMLDVMRFSADAYDRYYTEESRLIRQHRSEVMALGAPHFVSVWDFRSGRMVEIGREPAPERR
jgi:hypothetical protein